MGDRTPHPGGKSCCAALCKAVYDSQPNPMTAVPQEAKLRRQVLGKLGRIEKDIARYIKNKTDLRFCSRHLAQPHSPNEPFVFEQSDPIFTLSLFSELCSQTSENMNRVARSSPSFIICLSRTARRGRKHGRFTSASPEIERRVSCANPVFGLHHSMC